MDTSLATCISKVVSC